MGFFEKNLNIFIILAVICPRIEFRHILVLNHGQFLTIWHLKQAKLASFHIYAFFGKTDSLTKKITVNTSFSLTPVFSKSNFSSFTWFGFIRKISERNFDPKLQNTTVFYICEESFDDIQIDENSETVMSCLLTSYEWAKTAHRLGKATSRSGRPSLIEIKLHPTSERNIVLMETRKLRGVDFSWVEKNSQKLIHFLVQQRIVKSNFRMHDLCL